VCKRKVKDINELIDETTKGAVMPRLVSDREWEILSSDDLSAETLARQKHEQWLRKIEKDGPKRKKKAKQSESAKQLDETSDAAMDPFTEQVQEVLKQFKQRFPQYYLNGWENIWIVKPASLSRGRGIKCYQNLVEILDHMGSKESQWVVQKYIERPLVVVKRKVTK
jgi:tubulin monoglycylase TTLL3/8